MPQHSLSRRRLLGTTTAASALAVLPQGVWAARPAAGERPNILWLVSEDNDPFIGAYGDGLAHTPTIDALAARGVRYASYYSYAPVCAPTRFSIITGMTPESCAPADKHRAVAKLPAFIRGFPEYLRPAGYYCTNAFKTDYNCDLDPKSVWNASSAKAHWRDRPVGAPFFAVFNFETTHEGQIFKSTPGRVKPQDVQVPPYLPDTPGIREDRASYYNLMEKMDGQVAAKLQELEAAGLADDTIVFYYSDNGGVLPRSKRYLYEEGLHCPLVVYFPPKWAHLAPAGPGAVIHDPVTSVDLAPTVLSLAGAEIPGHMQGKPFLGRRRAKAQAHAFGMRDRMDGSYDTSRTATDGRFRYIRNYTPHRPWGQYIPYGWQQQGYKDWETAHLAGTLNADQDRFWQEKPFEEFYDLTADPHELTNLIGDPRHVRRVEVMRRALDRHMLDINDNGLIPEGSPLEGYLPSRVPGAYPLKTAMALAATAAQRDPRRLPILRQNLANANEVLRYWAAQGLLMLGDGAKSATGEMLARLPAEDSPQVRIVLAEALTKLGEAAIAVPVLRDYVATGTPAVRLQAINALTYVGDAARPALPQIEAAAREKDFQINGAARYLQLQLTGQYKPSLNIFNPPEGWGNPPGA